MQELYDIAVESKPDARARQLTAEIYSVGPARGRVISSARSATSRASRGPLRSRAPPPRVEPVRPADGARAVAARELHHRRGIAHRAVVRLPAQPGRPEYHRVRLRRCGADREPGTSSKTEPPVLRVESKTRPDFLRAYAITPDNPHGLEGSAMYDGLKRRQAERSAQSEAACRRPHS